MQYIKQFMGIVLSWRLPAFVATLLLSAAVWFVGPLLAVDGLRPLASVDVRIGIVVLLLALGLLWLLSGPASMVGVAAACLLVWHAGPLLSLGAARPLAPAVVRAAIIGIVLLAYAVYGFRQLLLAVDKDQQLVVNFLRFGWSERDSKAREELKTVADNLHRATQQLRTLRGVGGIRGIFEGKRHLYELPWYVVVGSPAAGKTTALMHSGLQFPMARAIGRVGAAMPEGTVHCDWWISNEAVLVDTAGRYSTHDSTAEIDRDEWRGFLRLLRKHRMRAPINGAIVVLNAWELIQQDAVQRGAHADLIRDRLAELRQQLGIRFPVYVIVTKIDLLRGFNEYFQSLTSEGRTQAWGFTLPVAEAKAGRDADRPTLHDRLATEFALLHDRLTAGLRARLNEEFDADRRRQLFALPQELASLWAPLSEMVDAVFLDSHFDRTQRDSALRGVYLTSGAQIESPVPADADTLVRRLARSIASAMAASDVKKAVAPAAARQDGLANESATAAVSTAAAGPVPGPVPAQQVAPVTDAVAGTAAASGAPAIPVPRKPPARIVRADTEMPSGRLGFFLRDVLVKVIIPEAHLVRPNLRWEFRFRLMRFVGHAFALTLFAWLASALMASFGNNGQYLAAVGTRAQSLSKQVSAMFADFQSNGVPEILSATRELPTHPSLDIDSPPARFLFGLYAAPPLLIVSRTTYAQVQDQVLLPFILARMEAVLAQSMRDRDATTAYAALRAYKLLHDPVHYMQDGGARDVRDWVLRDWETTDSAAVFGGRASMVGHVQALFSGERAVQAASLPNDALVRDVQDFLNGSTSTQRVYERAKAAMRLEAPQEFTLVRAVGPQAGTVFSRTDGQPLEKGVPGLFTYDGYHGLFNQRLPEFVAAALEDDAWVMGRAAQGAVDGAATSLRRIVDTSPRASQDSPLLDDVRRQYLEEYAVRWESFLDSIRTVSGSDATGASLGFDLSVLRQLAAPDSPLARLARAAARETTLSRPLVTQAQEDKGFLDKATDQLNQKTREIGRNLGIRSEERLEKQWVDNRFAALREVVTGQPDAGAAGLGAAGAKPGLEAISGTVNEFYTVLVVADTALNANSLPPGGAEIGAKLKLEAGKLPAPFREVLTALATSGSDKVTQGATQILRKQAQVQFDRIMGLMALLVSEPCKRGVEGRYPLAAVAQDAAVEDFTRVFATGGAADEFFSRYLAVFVDNSVRPWRYKSPDSANAMVGAEGFTSGAMPAPATTGPTLVGELLKLLAQGGPNLDVFYRAQQVRELFFRDAGGRKLAWKMEIKVQELEPSVTDLIIDIDGQGQRYVHGPVQPFTVDWPGPRGGSMAELTANPRISGTTSTVTASGPWALFRLIEKGRIVGTATPGHQSVEFAFDGRKAVLDISAGSEPNPLNSDVLKGFRCPGRVS
ncbi:hypothetical protein BH10PSE18_BH10PSE18_47720 [soil metagenome]